MWSKKTRLYQNEEDQPEEIISGIIDADALFALERDKESKRREIYQLIQRQSSWIVYGTNPNPANWSRCWIVINNWLLPWLNNAAGLLTLTLPNFGQQIVYIEDFYAWWYRSKTVLYDYSQDQSDGKWRYRYSNVTAVDIGDPVWTAYGFDGFGNESEPLKKLFDFLELRPDIIGSDPVITAQYQKMDERILSDNGQPIELNPGWHMNTQYNVPLYQGMVINVWQTNRISPFVSATITNYQPYTGRTMPSIPVVPQIGMGSYVAEQGLKDHVWNWNLIPFVPQVFIMNSDIEKSQLIETLKAEIPQIHWAKLVPILVIGRENIWHAKSLNQLFTGRVSMGKSWNAIPAPYTINNVNSVIGANVTGSSPDRGFTKYKKIRTVQDGYEFGGFETQPNGQKSFRLLKPKYREEEYWSDYQ